MGRLKFERESFAIKFYYPDTLALTTHVNVGKTAGASEGVRRVALALDRLNIVLVSRQELKLDTAFVEWGELRAEMDTTFAHLGPDVPSGTAISYAGMQGLEYRFDTDDDEQRHQWTSILFDHAIMYNVTCQSTPSGRSQIEEAGEMVFDTLEWHSG